MYSSGCELVDLLGKPTVIASEPMRAVLRLVQRVAQTPAAVLIVGETGTGKEHIGRAVHHYSLRCSRPWVDLNCATLPEHLMESELFGYEKGAFSGADSRKQGLMELADQGTMFLDEIGELDMKLQVKLLRVLDGTPYYRLGGVSKVAVDVRIVAATNQDPEELIRQGRFRRDLYHRLSEVTIRVPPLREREEDIVPLAHFFLKQLSGSAHFTEAAEAAMRTHDWPGNTRELKNVVTTAFVQASGDAIDIGCFPPNAVGNNGRAVAHVSRTGQLHELEREAILTALKHVNGHQNRAAEILGISSKTLNRKLKLYRQEAASGKDTLTTIA